MEDLFHIGSKNIELDQVLDLTDDNVRQIFKVGDGSLAVDDIATELKKDPKAYQYTHIIGDIAKRKGFKAIKAPSASDLKEGGENIISFMGLR